MIRGVSSEEERFWRTCTQSPYAHVHHAWIFDESRSPSVLYRNRSRPHSLCSCGFCAVSRKEETRLAESCSTANIYTSLASVSESRVLAKMQLSSIHVKQLVECATGAACDRCTFVVGRKWKSL